MPKASLDKVVLLKALYDINVDQKMTRRRNVVFRKYFVVIGKNYSQIYTNRISCCPILCM